MHTHTQTRRDTRTHAQHWTRLLVVESRRRDVVPFGVVGAESYVEVGVVEGGSSVVQLLSRVRITF